MSNKVKKLYRSEKDKLIAGVAGGVAEYFEIDSTIVRIIFIGSSIAWGAGFWIYLAMWLLVPTESNKQQAGGEAINQNVAEIKQKVKEAGQFVKGKVEDMSDQDGK